MSPGSRRHTLIALGLCLWISIAPGCSFCRSVGNYYSSSRWYEDLGNTAAAVLVLGFVVVAGVGIAILAARDGVDLGAGGYNPPRTSRATSSGYGWSDYYGTMSR